MSAESAASLAFDFSSWASFRFSCSIVAWPSDNLACSLSFAISSSSALAIPSTSYFCLHMSASPRALFSCLARFSLAETSSSVLLQAVRHVLHVPELAEEGDSLLGLVVGHQLLFIQGGSQGRLRLHHQAGVGIELLDLTEEICVLASHSPFGRLKVAKVQVGLFDPLGQVVQGCDEGAMRLLSRGLGPGHLVCCCTDVPNFICNLPTIFDNLGLHLVQLVHLLGHLCDGVRLLLLEACKSRLVLNVALLQIFPQLGNFSLALLIQLHLSRSRATRLVQTIAETLHLPSKIRSLPLRLGPGLPLGLQLLLHFFDPALQLFDALLHLSNK